MQKDKNATCIIRREDTNEMLDAQLKYDQFVQMISYLMHSCVWKHTKKKKKNEKKVAVGVVPTNETTVAVEMMNTQEVLQALSRLPP